MYENAVVGIDGLSGGRDAVALAKTLAASGALSYANVRVISTVPSRGSPAVYDAAEPDGSLELLRRERGSGRSDADLVSIAATSVGAGLHDVAESRGADLAVVGSCHRSAIGRVLTGDDARSVLHHSPCAVAVAPAGYADQTRRIETVAVAYDGSAESEVALAHATLLAEELGAKLVVRSVVERRVYGAAWVASIAIEDPESAVAAARARLGDLDEAEIEVIVGPVREELAALSEQVDVLVCGSRHQAAGKRVLLGSTSDYLARHSACPFIVTPAIDQKRVATWQEKRKAAAAV